MPASLRPPRALLFDLDGTLIDSHPSIAASVDHMLRAHGLPEPEPALREAALSFPLRMMMAKLTKTEDAALIERYAASYLEHYVAIMVEASNPFPGVLDVLDALDARGLPLAVLTNKTESNALRILEGRIGLSRFATVVGAVEGRRNKPATEGAALCAERLGVALEDCWLVGDSEIDIATARNAGMGAIGVTWGLTPTLRAKIEDADRLLDMPAALVELVDATR